MQTDSQRDKNAAQKELQHLRQVTNWPLGESGIFERFHWLEQHPSLANQPHETAVHELIQSLADIHQEIHATFDEFRPTFDPVEHYRPRHDPQVRKAARFHYFELLSTTRYEVGDLSQMLEIISNKFLPTKPLQDRHLIALAALVCFKYALEALEELTTKPPCQEVGGILLKASQSRDQASAWLAHLATLSVANQEAATQRKTNARQAASVPRKPSTRALSPEKVAKDFQQKLNGRPLIRGMQKGIVTELAEQYQVSARTVANHIANARAMNLMQ